MVVKCNGSQDGQGTIIEASWDDFSLIFQEIKLRSFEREGFCLELDVESVVNREITRRLSLDTVVSQLGFQINEIFWHWNDIFYVINTI